MSDLIRVCVRRESPVYMPNVFSPNDDGVNDKLYPQAGPNIKQIDRFEIFDRWGNMVWSAGPFQPNDPLYGWDGKLDGQPMDPAVFVYYVEVTLTTGEVVLLKGDVVLMR